MTAEKRLWEYDVEIPSMDIKQILSDASYSTVRKVIMIGTGMITVPALIRLTGADTYGIWATLIAFSNMIAIAGGLHLHGALIRFSQKENEEQTFSNIFTLACAVAVTLAFLIAVLSIGIESVVSLDPLSADLLIPIACLVAAKIFIKVLLNTIRAKGDIRTFEAIKSGQLIVETATIIVTIWLTKSLATTLWALFAVTFLLSAILFLVTVPRPLPRPNTSSFTQYLSYGLPMVPKELSGSVLHHGDKFLIMYFLGPTATGIYTVAFSVTSMIPTLPGVFNSTLYPRVTKAWDNGETEEIQSFYTAFFRWYGILSIPAVVGLSLLSGPVLRLISTPDIAEQGRLLVPILALAFAFQGLEIGFGYPLAAAEETKKIGYITFSAMVLNIILNTLFIPFFGVHGAAIASLIAYGAWSGLLYYYVSQLITIPLPTNGLLKSSLTTIMMIGILTSLPVDYWLYRLLVYPIVGALSFGVIFRAIGGFTESEWESFKSAVMRLRVSTQSQS